MSKRNNVYRITDGIELFDGNIKQIQEKIGTKNVYNLLSGKANSCKGWRLISE